MRSRRLPGAVAALLAVAAGLAVPGARAREDAVAAAPSRVYVLPIRKMIEPALLYVVRRGVAEAEAEHADAIVFVMDTPGGTVDAAREIVFTIQHVGVPTYTFVEKNAFSAGAIIALATDHIYMAPGSVIGDAMPIMMSPLGGVQAMPEGLEEKTVSAVSALIRSAAEQGGHNKELAEAMVRREMEFKIGDRVISPAGQLLTLTNEEAAETVDPAAGPLLSAGTVRDVDALLEAVGMPGATVRTLEVTSAERIARYVAALAPLFLIGGLLGIYLEIKTPGFGLPGLLGIACLAVFFWGHHLAGLAGSEDLLVFMAGFALLLVELLFIPGFGFVGALGIALMLAGLLLAMIQSAPGGPWWPGWPRIQVPLTKLSVTLVGTACAAAILGRFLPRSRTFRRMVLDTASDGRAGRAAAPPAAG